MNSQCDVLCVGETLVMIAPENAGRLNLQSRYSMHVGGAESNVATHLARLGHRASWAGQVGQDPFGEIIRSHLAESGVDVASVVTHSNAPTGVYFKDPQDGHTTVYYYRSGSAAAAMERSSTTTWSALRPAVVHVSGITAALSAGCRDLLRDIVVERSIDDASISFDVNFRPALWEVNDAAVELLSLARASDVCFVGQDEAESLWGTLTAESVRELIAEPSVLIVKDGSRGVVEFSPAGAHRVPAPIVDVVEVVGAGDAFAAGWLSGYLRGIEPNKRIRLGHAVASRVLQSVSDEADLPGSEVLDDLINRDPLTWHMDSHRVEG